MLSSARRVILAALVAALATSSVFARGSGPKPKTLTDARLYTVKGRAVSLVAATKGRVCIVKFGATWCQPCTMMLKELDKIIDHYGDKVRVIDIDMGERAAKVIAHYRKHGFKAELLLDPRGAAAKAFGVDGIPHTLVVGHDGAIAATLVGPRPASKLKPILDKLIAAAPKPEA